MHLEHVNITVPDPKASAAKLAQIFGWKIRWQGAAINDGFSVHIGDDESYLALYRPGRPLEPMGETYSYVGGINHVGIDGANTADERRIPLEQLRPAFFVSGNRIPDSRLVEVENICKM